MSLISSGILHLFKVISVSPCIGVDVVGEVDCSWCFHSLHQRLRCALVVALSWGSVGHAYTVCVVLSLDYKTQSIRSLSTAINQ